MRGVSELEEYMELFSEGEEKEFEVFSDQAGERLDKLLSLWDPEKSRSFFQKLIKEERIWVDGIPRKANYRAEEGDHVTVHLPKVRELEILPENLPLDIL